MRHGIFGKVLGACCGLLAFAVMARAQESGSAKSDAFAGAMGSADLRFSSLSSIYESSQSISAFEANSSVASSLSGASSSSDEWTGRPEIELEKALGISSQGSFANAPGRFLLGDMPEGKQKLLLQAFLRDQLLVMPPQTREYYASRDLRDAWEGNIPGFMATIKRVVLRFKRDPNSSAPFEVDHDPEWFDIVLDMRPNQWIMFHSEGRFATSRRGLAIDPTPPEQYKLFVEGKGVSGMALAVARVQKEGQFARAMLLCPRYLYESQSGPGSRTRVYMESPYRLRRALFSVNASLRGKGLTGGALGVARGSILATPNIARSSTAHDESYAIDPEVTLQYLPVTNEQLADVEEDGSVVAGIQDALDLQRAAGFRRKSSLTSVFWAKELTLGPNQPWFITKKGGRHPIKVASGPCYALLVEQLFEHRYTKEPFEIPDRLKASSASSSDQPGK